MERAAFNSYKYTMYRTQHNSGKKEKDFKKSAPSTLFCDLLVPEFHELTPCLVWQFNVTARRRITVLKTAFGSRFSKS